MSDDERGIVSRDINLTRCGHRMGGVWNIRARLRSVEQGWRLYSEIRQK